jgi:hypothetical protein
MWAHIRILLHSTVTDGDFASKIEAYRLGPLKLSATETRTWFQLSAKKDAELGAQQPDAGEEPLNPSVAGAPASKKQLTASLDILIELKMAQLLEIVKKEDGYYCTVGIRADSRPAVGALVSAAEYHLTKNVVGADALRLESPFLGATKEDVTGGIVERILCKVYGMPAQRPSAAHRADPSLPRRAIRPASMRTAPDQSIDTACPQISVFAGRMTAINIQTKDDKRLVGPGDSAAELCKMAPFGYCDASIHLMGFWHNEIAFSPVIYLTNAQLTAPPIRLEMPPFPKGVLALADMSNLNPLRKVSFIKSTEWRQPPPLNSTALSQPVGDTYDAGDSVLALSPISSRASDNGRNASPPALRRSSEASFMSQASTAVVFDSDEEETDRDHTPPIMSPKKMADVTWVTCGLRADDDWAKPAKGKAPAFMRPVPLPGDKAMRAHPNATVRSLFKD